MRCSVVRSVNVRTLRSGSCRSCEAIDANCSSSALERASSRAWRPRWSLQRTLASTSMAVDAAPSSRLASAGWTLVSARVGAVADRARAGIARRTSSSEAIATRPKAMKINHGSHFRNPETLANSGPSGAARKSLQVGSASLTWSASGLRYRHWRGAERCIWTAVWQPVGAGRPPWIGRRDDHPGAVHQVVVRAPLTPGISAQVGRPGKARAAVGMKPVREIPAPRRRRRAAPKFTTPVLP